MWYRQALKIGSVAEGMIKCTYAAIYARPDDKKALFAIQHAPVRKVMAVVNDDPENPFATMVEFVDNMDRDPKILQALEYLFYKSITETPIIDSPGDGYENREQYGGVKMDENQGVRASSWRYGSVTHAASDLKCTMIGDDIPLVWIDQIDNENKLVPAHISEFGLNIMKASILGFAKLTKGKDEKDTLYRYDFDGLSNFMRDNGGYHKAPTLKTNYVVKRINISGDSDYKEETIVAYLKEKPTYEEFRSKWKDKEGEYEYRVVEVKSHYADVLQRILDLQPGDLVYVKPDAFNWMPTNIDNLTVELDGEKVLMKDAYESVNKKIKDCKLLRAISIGASILG